MNKLNQIKKVQHVYGCSKEQALSQGALTKMTVNMDEPISEETHVTTVIVDQGATATEFFAVPPEISYAPTPSDIKNFLEKDNIRPVVVWSTSSIANTVLTNFNPGLSLTTDSKYINKLYGLGLIRYKIEVTIKINAYAFQSGRLLLHYLPMSSYISAGAVATRNYLLSTKTQQPNIEIDCRDTSKKMIVPYVSPHSWMDLNTGSYLPGTFYLSVLSRLSTGPSGSTDADVTISWRFIDVELMAPMVANSSEAVAMSSSGSISKGLRAAKKVASALSSIPQLSAYAGPTAWALDRAAGLASSYGFSKPLLDSEPITIHDAPWKYSATGDGPDNSYPLGVLKAQSIARMEDVTIRPDDEMSMAYLLSVKGYVNHFTWAAAPGVGVTNLYTKNLQPSLLAEPGSYASGVKTASTTSGPPVWYLSNFFKYWRGSLKLHLKFIKTQFHTGRIVITFTPGTSGFVTPADSTYSLRHYVDIREADEIELTFPYMTSLNWLTSNQSSGFISIDIVNNLRAPETCSSSIDVLTFWSAGPDFEFGGPMEGLNSNPVLMVGNSDMPGNGTEKVIISDVIGAAKVPSMTLTSDMMSIGENITSIKQLLNRNSLIQYNSYPASNGLTISPWFWSATTTTPGAITAITCPGGDFMSAMALMYSFFRGGIRVMICGMNDNCYASLWNKQNNNYIDAPRSLTHATWYLPGQTSHNAYGVGIVSYKEAKQHASFIVPYYNDERCSVVDFSTTNSHTLVDASYPEVVLNVVGYVSPPAPTFRSAAEDFQLSLFIGCPPILIGYS